MRLPTLQRDPRAFVYLERYVNGGSRTYSRHAAYNEVAPPYRPLAPEPHFALPRVQVPFRLSQISLDSPNPDILARYLNRDHFAFPLHPETLLEDSGYAPRLRNLPLAPFLRVSPTSSTRTVFVHDAGPPHCLKVHCPRRISRFVRRLRKVSVHFSVAVSRDLREFDHPDFGYLPETVGVSVGADSDAGFGFIIRELRPYPARPEGAVLVPLFSLYAEDLKRPQDPPLLVQLVRLHGADPAEFVLRRIMFPLISTWCAAVRERGIVFGAHGQNALLELDSSLRPLRIIHRDLDLQVDPAIRAARGLPCDFHKSRIGIDLADPRPALYSLKYDSFLGHHLFDYLALTLRRHFGTDPARLRAACREYFRTMLPEYADLFDGRTWYYGDRILPDNEIELVPVGRPAWR